MTFRHFIFGIIILLLFGCQQPKVSPLEQALWSAHPAMANVLHDPDGYEIQIAFSEIQRDSAGKPRFKEYGFRLDSTAYFYPASTVKLPVAVLALEYLQEQGIPVDTPYTIGSDSLPHSVSDDLKQIFTVSDNDAYNRLYELLGRDYVNDRMRMLHLGAFRLAHRLSTANAAWKQRDSLRFQLRDSLLILGGGSDSEIQPFDGKTLKKGKGYRKDGRLINEPMDFSEKNYFPIGTQHRFMQRLFFPEAFPDSLQLKVSPSNRKLLFGYMSAYPREFGYDASEFYDSYGKFFIYGDSKDSIHSSIKIFNKVGYAYGTLTETAYVEDKEKGVSFLLSATILVNKNRIFNDDTYEYETIGIPFLAQLGRELYVGQVQKP